MGLGMKVRRAVLKELAKRYQRGSKRDKGLVLEEFVGLTDYSRCYASWLLRNCGRKVVLLNATDVACGWVETAALRNRAQVWAFQALERIKQMLPFPCWG